MALVAMLVAAPATEANHRELRFGVHSLRTPTQPEFARMGKGAVGVLRMDFLWNLVEPTEGNYNWNRYDSVVREASRNNIPVLPVIIGSPQWVAPRPGYPPTSRNDRRSYKRFVKRLVRRYGRGGDFWQANGSVPYTPITAFQVWNEPSLEYNWGGDPDPREYAKFLELSRKAIEDEDRKATIVMAGMPEYTGVGMSLRRYLKELYRVRGIKRQFDVLAIHPYASREEGVDGALSRLHDFLVSRDDGNRRVWITELGWSTGGPNSFTRKTPEQQAELLRKTFKLLERRQSRYRLGTVAWFSWRDIRDPRGDQWAAHTGLFELDGDPKPAWPEFTRFTGGNSSGGRIPPPLVTKSLPSEPGELAERPELVPSPPELVPSPPELVPSPPELLPSRPK